MTSLLPFPQVLEPSKLPSAIVNKPYYKTLQHQLKLLAEAFICHPNFNNKKELNFETFGANMLPINKSLNYFNVHKTYTKDYKRNHTKIEISWKNSTETLKKNSLENIKKFGIQTAKITFFKQLFIKLINYK